MFAKVYVLTLLSEVHVEQGRYAVSCDVVLKNKTNIIKKKRKSEEQVYVDHKSVIGGLSPEIELQLKNHKCEIQLAISGALKPQSKFEKGEDIIEYSESLSECRKLFALVPTYDEAAEGIATIKFKVDGKVKHTVTIHGVPATKELNKSESSQQTIDEGSVMAGSSREAITSASGEGRWTGGDVHALPHPSRPLERGMENLAIGQRRPDVVPPEDSHDFETAYGKILCNESLSNLSWALSPSDAHWSGCTKPDSCTEPEKIIKEISSLVIMYRNGTGEIRENPEHNNTRLAISSCMNIFSVNWTTLAEKTLKLLLKLHSKITKSSKRQILIIFDA